MLMKVVATIFEIQRRIDQESDFEVGDCENGDGEDDYESFGGYEAAMNKLRSECDDNDDNNTTVTTAMTLITLLLQMMIVMMTTTKLILRLR